MDKNPHICCQCGYPFDTFTRRKINPHSSPRREIGVVYPDGKRDIVCSECAVFLSARYEEGK